MLYIKNMNLEVDIFGNLIINIYRQLNQLMEENYGDMFFLIEIIKIIDNFEMLCNIIKELIDI